MNTKPLSQFNLLILIVLLFIAGCGDKALFDELATNRVKVLLKGTYASNNPQPWTGQFPEDDSVDDYQNSSVDEDPTFFMLDIAEMKIIDAVGEVQQPFANYREPYIFNLNDDDPFFNGSGVLYNNDDMRPDLFWSYLQIYIRKMIINNPMEYKLIDDDDNFNGVNEWQLTEDNPVTTLFNEKYVSGRNFNLYQLTSYYESLLSVSPYINRIFPLNIYIEDGFVFRDDYQNTVLEIRMVIKNFIKKYEKDLFDENNQHRVEHFYALSDWLRDVKSEHCYSYIDANNVKQYSFINECIDMGGNIITVVRSYVPELTATLSGNAGNSNCYVIAINSSHHISEYEVADRTRPTCDMPKMPPFTDESAQPLSGLPNDLESRLDYYLKYEKYKKDFNVFKDCFDTVDSETNLNEYETGWNDYNNRLSGFKIPTLATWVGDSGTYTLTAVPVGNTYTIYRATSGNSIAELPGNFVSIGSITVLPEQAGEPIIVP